MKSCGQEVNSNASYVKGLSEDLLHCHCPAGYDIPTVQCVIFGEHSNISERAIHSHCALTRIDCDNHNLSDRKSTRLNSSHQIISYAVFCLKKKRNNRHE